MNLFAYADYKEIIRAKIEENKQHRAYRSTLADAIGCQKSFLSQVIRSHVHLTPDHAAGLSAFWGLTDEESAYFIDLVLIARSGSRALKALLSRRIKKARAEREEPSERFKWPKAGTEAEQGLYYSSWYWAAIHVIVSVPQYNTAAEIARRLDLPVPVVENALIWLEARKFIAKSKSGWQVTKKQIYLPNTSPLAEGHHSHWRQRCISDLQRQDKMALHYSSVFTLSESDFHVLKEMVVGFLESLNKAVAPSSPEEIACFTCDFFKL